MPANKDVYLHTKTRTEVAGSAVLCKVPQYVSQDRFACSLYLFRAHGAILMATEKGR
jgi:hypothetical protein